MWEWTVWKLQWVKFTENCCVNLGTNETDYRLTCITLGRNKQFGQIRIMLELPGTRLSSINNNVKTVVYREHKTF